MAHAAARTRGRASARARETLRQAKSPEEKPPAEDSPDPKAAEEDLPEETPPERRVRRRSDIERETTVARNRDEIPERFLGRLKCPGCHRVIEVETREDLETMKIHVRNRAHGTLNDCVRIEPGEGVRDS